MAYYSKDMWKDFQSIFPEHTKTVPRIIVWSIILLADLVCVTVLAFHWGILDAMSPKLAPVLIVAGMLLLFWVESTIWKAFLRIFR